MGCHFSPCPPADQGQPPTWLHLAKSNFSHNTGDACVDVIDQHSYRQPPEEVARLVESLRAKDIWALRAAYRSQIADNPTYLLAMDMGGQVHRLGR